MTSTKNSKKREAPKNSNKVQKKDQTDKPPRKKVRTKKTNETKNKENKRTRNKQTKRKKSKNKKRSARLEQSARILSCEKSKYDVKSSKSNVSPESTTSLSIVNSFLVDSSTAISPEGVLESPQKKVSPESKDREIVKETERNKVKSSKSLYRIWNLFNRSKSKSKSEKDLRIDKKIREELHNGKDIASIVEFIKATVDVEPKISHKKKPLKANHEICKKKLKEPHNRKTVTLSEEAYTICDIGKEQNTLKHRDHKKTLKHKDPKETLKPKKDQIETFKHKDHKKILKHFASKIKIKVPTDKIKNNDATSNNTHDNCNNDAKDDLKLMSSILKTFNIPRESREKGLEEHMLHFLYEHYRTFLNKYMVIAKFRNWDYFQNEDVEKAIEKLNEETESAFPPLIEELILKAIQENSSVQHAFCRSSESNKADELKVLDTENTVSNKDNTAGVDENNHSVINNYNTQLLIQNYVRTLNENRYFNYGITNSQLVQKCQHEQNNINELTEKESSITCNTDPQYSMLNNYHEQKTIGLNESSVPVTNKQNLQYSMFCYCYGENGTSKLDENAHPQTNDNYLQNIVPKYGPIEKGTFKLDENAHSLANDTNPQEIKPLYEDIESSEDENASVDGDLSPKRISFQDNPPERNMPREVENVSVAGDTLPKQFIVQDNLAEANMPREDENVSVAGGTLPQHFSFQDNFAESISCSEEENVSVAGDTSPKHFNFQDSLTESNSSSEDENVSVAGDISPKHFSYPSEWKSYENTCYSTKEVISERLDHLRASMFYNIF